MGRSSAERVALMAIHPRYADAILDGTKRVEFRKRRLAEDIRTVLIYATAPVSRVVGRFTIDDIIEATPGHIWEAYGEIGVIEEDAFFGYYGDAAAAVAILVADAERFSAPLALADIKARPAVPQSFAYLAADDPGLVPA